MLNTQKVLHVGCGQMPLPAWISATEEVRLDIDDTYNPDIVADMRVPGDWGKYDVIYCSHALEHLYPHEVTVALANFKNALNANGFAIVIVPNLEDIKPTDDFVYMSESGPITGLDMIYGCKRFLEKMPYMAHHTGFVRKTLDREMRRVFKHNIVTADTSFNLIAIGSI